jgi:nickel superoxide dismutase
MKSGVVHHAGAGRPALLAAVVLLACANLLSARALAHCQIPCGIYDDPARIDRLYEDTATIEKSVHGIQELADKTDAESVNQRVRWVVNKDDHASDIMEIIANYFLAQRIKPLAEGEEGRAQYLTRLARHHAVIVAAMKTKQNADLEHVQELRQAIDAIAGYYPRPEAEHSH